MKGVVGVMRMMMMMMVVMAIKTRMRMRMRILKVGLDWLLGWLGRDGGDSHRKKWMAAAEGSFAWLGMLGWDSHSE